LPFFREIVEDEEFISGKLDTGFIARFNERKKPKEIDQTEQDLALIAAALAYTGKQTANQTDANVQTASRWAMAGRMALLQNRL
jgi:acetyl/propionyl-CoA carboxylase alpha subunit